MFCYIVLCTYLGLEYFQPIFLYIYNKRGKLLEYLGILIVSNTCLQLIGFFKLLWRSASRAGSLLPLTFYIIQEFFSALKFHSLAVGYMAITNGYNSKHF